MEDAIFTSDRMNVAATRLRDRYRQVSAAEENARRQVDYERVISARDKLAEELAKTYPTLVATLADLINRIDNNNNEINAINNKLPDGGSRVLEAELIARDMRGFVENGIQATSIVGEMRIPAWDHDVHQPYAWPLSDRIRQHAVVLSIRA